MTGITTEKYGITHDDGRNFDNWKCRMEQILDQYEVKQCIQKKERSRMLLTPYLVIQANLSHNTSYIDGKKAIVHSLLFATLWRIQELKKATQQDETLQKIVTYLNTGWPSYKKYTKDDTTHTKVFHRANTIQKTVLFWPGTLKDIENFISKCIVCQQYSKSNREQSLKPHQTLKDIENFISKCIVCQQYSKSNREQSLKPHQIAELPRNKIGVDSATIKNKDYLVNDIMSKPAKAIIEVLEKY
ncbi:hypothetical protein QE152_g1214 [Popillia japonica]|uniref:Integrase zinc-binding domain-containing protein n=1 Tax=Popillia japonica TaxID=7064 RepID=A0AAW1NBA4_POPJA